jgi:ABC-type Fe3+/spermidine/putrescine transport system ATPase subunit
MNVWDNATYGPRVRGFDVQKARTIGHEVLELVKLHERLGALPSELSGGMMQRTAIARALAAGAKTLLLDEPLGQLDAKVRNEIRYDIRRMAKDLGLTAIHVTHDQAEAMSISDRIAVMKKGRVLQVGSPKELYMTPNSIFVAHFIGESNFLEGHILEPLDERAIIELRGGIQVQAITKNTKKDERVVLAIRPEAIKMEKSGTHAKRHTNSLMGTVEKITFEGNNVRYDARLENLDPLVVVQPSLSDSWFDAQQKVTLTFEPEKAHVFPYPEPGLKEETTVE